MANFESFKQKVFDTAENVADKSVELYKIAESKTKTFAKIAKLSSDSSKDRNKIKKLYMEIGQIYYELHSADPEDAFAQNCEEITAALERIVQRQREIDEIKSEGNYTDIPDEDIDADIEIEIVSDDEDEDTCCGDSCCCASDSNEDSSEEDASDEDA